MKKTSAELKTLAKQSLLGNYGIAAGSILLLYVILVGIIVVVDIMMSIGMLMFVSAVNDADAFSLGLLVVMFVFISAIFILEYMVIPGFIRLYMNICQNRRGEIGDIFYAFNHNIGKFFLLSIMISGFLFVIMLISFFLNYFLLSHMGISIIRIIQTSYMVIIYVISFLAVLNYGLVYFLMIEYPEKSLGSCLKVSCQMMQGNKGRLFYMMISFIGWYLIGYCTFGLAFLWLIPYMGCTFTHFYLDLKQDLVFPAV